MGAWKLQEFKTFCEYQGLERPLFYTESLALKFAAAKYHRDRLEEKMGKIDPQRLSLEMLVRYDFEIAFEIDALMMTLNSMWDILGQLINACFIHDDPNEISFNKLAKCHPELIPAKVMPILRSIQEHSLYATIKEYANVSKHQHAIKGDVHVDFGETPTRVSYETKEFKHRQKQQRRLTPEKASKCLSFVGKSVDKVGAQIQRGLKKGSKY